MKMSLPSIPNFLRAGLAVALVCSLAACGGGGGSSSGGDTGGGGTTTPSYGGGLTPGSVAMTITHQVTLTTNLGKLVIGLDGTHAPLSTANFLAYVNSGFYNSTLFHRVVPGFVIQGGGYVDTSGVYSAKATSAAIGLESRNGLSNTQYTIGMARTSDPNSATSQFYINLVNNASSLDFPASDNAGYAVFGTVSASDTVSVATINAIAAAITGTNTQLGATNWPLSDIVITSAVVNF